MAPRRGGSRRDRYLREGPPCSSTLPERVAIGRAGVFCAKLQSLRGVDGSGGLRCGVDLLDEDIRVIRPHLVLDHILIYDQENYERA